MKPTRYRAIAQYTVIIFCLVMAGLGIWSSVVGIHLEQEPNSPGMGLGAIVLGAVVLALAGVVVTIAGKLLGEK